MLNINELKNLNALKISLASGDEMRGWSYGEVTKPETINYRTFKPERDGLFDEKIFGPVHDFKCACGKYNGYRYKGVICDKCGVEVTKSKVRRERMGHIELAAPVVHVWYFKGIPSKLALLLDSSPKNLEAVIYFSSYILMEVDYDKKAEAISEIEVKLTNVPETTKKEMEEEIALLREEAKQTIEGLSIENEKKKQAKIKDIEQKLEKKIKKLESRLPKEEKRAEKRLLRVKKKLESMDTQSVMTDSEYYSMKDSIDYFAKVGIGAEAVLEILKNQNWIEIAGNLKKQLPTLKGQAMLKVSKRLKLIESLRRAELDPSWMILNTIPVIPPDLRPMVQLDGGRFATSDLNDLYRRVINRNNRLKSLLAIGAPSIITRNEKRMLQEAVDALIDAGKTRRVNRLTRGTKPLKSLADMIKGKQGRFRQNLLGKRVDFSGRAVIVAGPELRINECGIPKKMALELFKPFVLRDLLQNGYAPNIKTARIMIDEEQAVVYDVLEGVVKDRPVLLNRAPTLHKLGIQGFYPKLIEGFAVRLHPLVCVGFNADFDGDQMAVHVPITEAAVNEVKTSLMSTNNFLKPAAGEFVSLATRDMYLGTYFLTKMTGETPKNNTVYSKDEAITAFINAKIEVNEPINVQFLNGERLITCVGRIMVNEAFPKDYGFVQKVIDRSVFKKLAEDIHLRFGNEETARFLDIMKDLGFKWATVSGLSVSVTDVEMVKNRTTVIADAEKKIQEIEQNYFRGLITRQELRSLSHSVWMEATDLLDVQTWNNLDENNPLKVMVNAGAGKASRAQIKQIGGMKGLVQDPNGKLVDLPVRSNYRIGLTSFETFNAARGARKGLTDKGLKTADAGYLTRRLVDVAQDAIIREDNCGQTEGRLVTREDKTSLAEFTDRIRGRYLAKPVLDAKGKTLVEADSLITADVVKQLDENQINEVEIRSPLTCKTRYGVCSKCYGLDLSTLKEVEEGEAVGVIAAQAIGEPGTQLTMKTFHTGGIAGKDITMGLPRVEEIFESRNPKNVAIMAEISGKVTVKELDNNEREIVVTSLSKNADVAEVTYKVDPVSEIIVKDKQLVNAGDALTLGYLNLNELMVLSGIKATQRYVIDQVQKVYSSQGVLLDDKHIEIIVSKMFNKVEIVEGGDSSFFPGEVLSKDLFDEINENILAEGGSPAKAKVILLGISKSSLNTDSFLSAASFQETTRVLSEAACAGEVDKLRGLKESVIAGKLIPVGTGYKKIK